MKSRTREATLNAVNRSLHGSQSRVLFQLLLEATSIVGKVFLTDLGFALSMETLL